MEETRRFDTGRIKLSFADADGEVFASLRVDPTDAGLPARAEEVAKFFAERREEIPKSAGEMAEYSRQIEEKISYLLGYDAKDELFSRVSATTVSPDGELFAYAVIDAVAGAVAPELERRAARMRERAAQYTDKYEER